MKDQAVLNDFLHYFINKNKSVKTAINLDHVILLISHLKSHLNSKYECYQIIAAKSSRIILDSICDVII